MEQFSHSSSEELERLIGQIIKINPASLLKRKRLYTTQNWISADKLTRALSDEVDNDDDIPSGWICLKKGEIVYIVGDGNHRIGIACIDGREVAFRVKGLWPDDKKLPYKFNGIVNQIRGMHIGLSVD